MRQLVLSWAFGPLAALERALDPLRDSLAMFALIVLRRRASDGGRPIGNTDHS